MSSPPQTDSSPTPSPSARSLLSHSRPKLIVKLRLRPTPARPSPPTLLTPSLSPPDLPSVGAETIINSSSEADDVGTGASGTSTGLSKAPVPTDANGLIDLYALPGRRGRCKTCTGRRCRLAYDKVDDDDCEPFEKLIPYYTDDLDALRARPPPVLRKRN